MRRLRILLVDNNATFLEEAARFLEVRAGIEIVGKVLTGHDAVQQTPELEPEVVLIDLMMPGMNGLQATQRLKQLAEPPVVIVVSLYDDASFRAAALEAGADGFLAKREFSKQLLPLIENLLSEIPECVSEANPS